MPPKRKASPTSQNVRKQRLKKNQHMQEDPPVRHVAEQDPVVPNDHIAQIGPNVKSGRTVIGTPLVVPNVQTQPGTSEKIVIPEAGPPITTARQTRSQRKAQEIVQTSAAGAGAGQTASYLPGESTSNPVTTAVSKTKNAGGAPKTVNSVVVASAITPADPPTPLPPKKKKPKKKSKKVVTAPVSPAASADNVAPRPPSSERVHSSNNIESPAPGAVQSRNHSDSVSPEKEKDGSRAAAQPCNPERRISPVNPDSRSPAPERSSDREYSFSPGPAVPPKSPTALVMSPGMEQLFLENALDPAEEEMRPDVTDEESPPGTPVDLLRKYAPRRVNYDPIKPSYDGDSEEDSDSDEELFDASTFEQLFGQNAHVENNYKAAFKGSGKYDEDDPLTIWLIDEEEHGPCDYMFKTTKSGEVRYYGEFPRKDISGVTELFSWYRPGGSGSSWLPIPPGCAVPRQSVHQRAWAQRDFDAMAAAAGINGVEEKMCESSDYAPSDADESDDDRPGTPNHKKTTSNRPPRNSKGKRRATRPRSKSPVRRAGRPTRVEIEHCEELGKEIWERVEELADRFGRDQQTIMVAAGLYLRTIRLQNIWNCWQTRWRIKYPEIVAEDKAWKRRCSAEYHAFMGVAENDPELRKAKEEEILKELEDMAKDPDLVLNAVAQMNAVLSDSRKQCKTERFLRDIHVLKFVIYTGPNASAAERSGVVTGSPLILEMIQNGNCRIQELINMLTGLIKGYQTNKEVDIVLDRDIQNSPPPAGPVVHKKTLPSKVKAVRKVKSGAQVTGYADEETWLALNDASLEIYRNGARQTSLGLTSTSAKITIRTVIAAHLAEEYNLLRPFETAARGNFPWANWPVCAVASQLTIVGWPFSFWPGKADALDKDQYRIIAAAYIKDFDSGPKLVRWTEAQKSLDTTSFDYGNIPLVVNTAGEPVIRLYHKNRQYLTAYAAAHPKGRDHRDLESSESPARPEEFMGYPITDDKDASTDGANQPHLYRISESPEPSAYIDADYQDQDDIEEFTEDEIARMPSERVQDVTMDHEDVRMASQRTIPTPHAVRYPAQGTHNDVFQASAAANANNTSGGLGFILPPPPPRPRGDIAPTRARDGVERMDHLRRQQRRIVTPVNPDIFYGKSVQARNIGHDSGNNPRGPSHLPTPAGNHVPGASVDRSSRNAPQSFATDAQAVRDVPALVSTPKLHNNEASRGIPPRKNHHPTNSQVPSHKVHAPSMMSSSNAANPSRNIHTSRTIPLQREGQPVADNTGRPDPSSQQVYSRSSRNTNLTQQDVHRRGLSSQEAYLQSSRDIHAPANPSQRKDHRAADNSYSRGGPSSRDVRVPTNPSQREAYPMAGSTHGYQHGTSSSGGVRGAPHMSSNDTRGPGPHVILAASHMQSEAHLRRHAATNSMTGPARRQGEAANHHVPPQARRSTAYFSSDEDNVNRPATGFRHRPQGNGVSGMGSGIFSD